MSRTGGFWLQDTPLPDGRIFVPAGTAVSNPTVVVAGIGLMGVAIAAAATATFDFAISDLLIRYGMQDDAQHQYGTATITGGVQGAQAIATPPAAFTTPYGPSGRPPQLASAFGQPVLSRPKGLKPLAMHAIYSVAGVALTSVAVSLAKTSFVSTLAPAVTQIIPVTTTGNPVAVSLTGIGTVAVAPTLQAFLNDQFDELTARVTFVAPTGSTGVFYGFALDVAFNYN